MAGMPERGLEPPPSYLDKNLNLARLPIPPLGQVGGRPESPADFENDATSGRRRYNYREKGDKKKATAATLTKKDKEVPVIFSSTDKEGQRRTKKCLSFFSSLFLPQRSACPFLTPENACPFPGLFGSKCLSFSRFFLSRQKSARQRSACPFLTASLTKRDKEVPTKRCLSFFRFFPAQNACPFPFSGSKCLSFSPFPAFPAFCPFPAFSRKNACPFFLFSLFFFSLSFSLSFSRLFPLFESDSKISILSPHFFRLEIQECLSWMHPALDAPCVLDATWVHVPGCT